jgi:hypothetical protein
MGTLWGITAVVVPAMLGVWGALMALPSAAAHYVACLVLLLAGLWTGGVGFMWLRRIATWDWTIILRILGLAVFIFIVTPWLIWFTWPEAGAQPTTPPAINGNCNNNSGTFSNSNCGNNTYNIGPVPRRIPPGKAGELAQALGHSGAIGSIEVQTDLMGCADCDGLARQIAQILRSAQSLSVKPIRNGMTISPYRGVALAVKDANAIPESAKAILNAFHSAGIDLKVISQAPIGGSESAIMVFQPTT